MFCISFCDNHRLWSWRSNRHLRISLRWLIYHINSVDESMLSYSTPPPTRHHGFFRNRPPVNIILVSKHSVRKILTRLIDPMVWSSVWGKSWRELLSVLVVANDVSTTRAEVFRVITSVQLVDTSVAATSATVLPRTPLTQTIKADIRLLLMCWNYFKC